ncbi:YegS/Rv2252/BmrU family lipid kinase [Leucobacter exalbidus]|uniref:YegS/Rv2252/BmrU family lipid kinase n=1 Tax=Leucobacter exalbidus TaxID=662960 RepID=A0A940PU92_9MICO|nr:diacylglycerol kinase family protein [Leucobacter exalbidus]MBP1326923.1 YegS/Rv2252/BmrU family lipid kinase [Leucobacter exalbidus]
MTQQIAIVWNPSKVEEDELRAAFTAASAEHSTGEAAVHWIETTVDDPGRGATEEALAAGCDLVIAAGGDGTVRAVASALGETGTPRATLGIVPLGTGNLLARNLSIPLGDPQAAFALALAGKTAPIDLGQVRYVSADQSEHAEGFVVMTGFGIDAQMIVETDDDLKAKAGWLAYVESLGRAVSGTDLVDLTLTRDDGDPVTMQAHTLLVANCGTLQGGITLLPDAQPDDGELDLLLLSADGVTAWLDTMRNMMWDNGLKRLLTRATSAESSDSAEHGRATRVRVELPTALEFEVDGDEVGEVTSFDVTVLAGALQVRVAAE